MHDEPLTAASFLNIELEILGSMADGLSNTQIAQRFGLTPGTVKWHLKHIYAKLSVEGREQAIARAREQNLVHLPVDQPNNDPNAERRTLRMINSLPMDVSGSFVGYKAELETLIGLIQKPSRLICITGRSGSGKTALACKALTMLRFNPNVSPAWDGIVSLSAAGQELNLDQVLGDLGRLQNRDERAIFDAMIRSNELTWVQKIGGILEEFAGRRIILLLDNLEALQHPDTGELQDTNLKLFIEKALAQSGTLTLIVTASQPLPLPTLLLEQQKIISLDAGLAVDDALELLRSRDPANETGLQTVQDADLSQIARRLGCFPRALQAFAGMLLENPGFSVPVFGQMLPDLDDDAPDWIAAHALSRLNADLLRILQALAVYNQPVGYDALAFLLAPYLGTINLRPSLARLVRAGFIQVNRETQQYALHPLDRIYSYASIPQFERHPDHAAPLFTRSELHSRAADYFHKKHLTRLQWRQLSDLAPQFNEFNQRIAAGDYAQAAQVLLEIDRDHLWEWGQKNLLRQKYALLAERIGDPILAHQAARRQAWLKFFEMPREAEREFRRLLEEARRMGYTQGEADALDDLAQITRRGAGHEAFELHRQALAIYRQLGDRRGEAEALGGMGSVLTGLMDGDQQQSVEFLEAAVALQREMGNYSRLSYLLSMLGIAYENLGQLTQAIKSHLEAVILSKEINHIELFVRAMIALARTYSLAGQHERAVALGREAVDRARSITGAQMTNLLLIATSTYGLVLGFSGDMLGGIAVLSQGISEANNESLPYMPVTYAYLSQLLFLYGDLQAARVLLTPNYQAPQFYVHNAWMGIMFTICDECAEHAEAQAYLSKVLAAAAPVSNNAPARYAAALAQAGLAYLEQDRAGVQSAAILYRQARAQAELPLRVQLARTILGRLAERPDGALLEPVLDVLRS